MGAQEVHAIAKTDTLILDVVANLVLDLSMHACTGAIDIKYAAHFTMNECSDRHVIKIDM